MAISVGDAVLKLGVDTKDLDRGLKGLGNRIRKHQKAIGIGMAAAGAAILAAGILSVKTYAKMGDEVQKMALRTGFTTEALSELRHAAEISGASLSSLEKAVKRMSGTILDAQDGLETYIRAFQHIGIEIEELEGLDPEAQFLRIAEAIAELEDPTKRAAIAQDIFGRAGTELLPLFAAGKEGLKALREEAHELGIVFDQEAANKAAEFTDAMLRVEEAASGLKIELAEILMPVLLEIIEKIKEIVVGLTDWAKQHETLTKIMVFLTTALGGLLVILAPVIIMLDSLIDIWLAVRVLLMTRVIPAIVAFTAALWAKAAALFAVMIAMGPVGWALAATGMALITTGLIALQREHTKQLEFLAEATEDLTETTEEQTKQAKAQAGALGAVAEAVVTQSSAFAGATTAAHAYLNVLRQFTPVLEGVGAAVLAVGPTIVGGLTQFQFHKIAGEWAPGIPIKFPGGTQRAGGGGSITVNNILDGEIISRTVIDRLGQQVGLQGGM